MAESKTELAAAKKSGLLAGLQGLGSFIGQTFVAYQTAKAPPATIAPAPAPTPLMATTSSSPSSGLSPSLVIAGAAVLGFLVLRRR